MIQAREKAKYGGYDPNTCPPNLNWKGKNYQGVAFDSEEMPSDFLEWLSENLRDVVYRSNVNVALAKRGMTFRVRVPKQRLETLIEQLGDHELAPSFKQLLSEAT